jgi:hypothetical protein
MNGFKLKIQTSKNKTMAFQGKNQARWKIVVNNKIIKVFNLDYLGYSIFYSKMETKYQIA